MNLNKLVVQKRLFLFAALKGPPLNQLAFNKTALALLNFGKTFLIFPTTDVPCHIDPVHRKLASNQSYIKYSESNHKTEGWQ